METPACIDECDKKFRGWELKYSFQPAALENLKSSVENLNPILKLLKSKDQFFKKNVLKFNQ
jgi:hypothetical protein